MCTVTYLPLNNNDFILTSSRDVPYSREKALIPKMYFEDGMELFYPKDGKAGGSWIGTSNRKRLICLLNGGFENHTPKNYYAKSRGLILKELLKCDDISLACKHLDLEDIEPFTLVIVEWDFQLFLFEFVWDGMQKHLKILPQKPAIWSSSTLYTDEMKQMRVDWFKEWQLHSFDNDVSSGFNNEILNFHKTAGIGNPTIDVLMDRKSVGTVSITLVEKNGEEIEMDYQEINH